jgi:diacylglycerol kinase
MPQAPFSFRERLRSIRYAIRGSWLILRTQHAAWIHSAVAVILIVAGLFFGLSRIEWCVTVLAMTAVWTAEGLNTSLEFLCDLVSPDHHPLIEKAKDSAAGAVTFTVVGLIVVVLLVFGPHVWK